MIDLVERKANQQITNVIVTAVMTLKENINDIDMNTNGKRMMTQCNEMHLIIS